MLSINYKQQNLEKFPFIKKQLHAPQPYLELKNNQNSNHLQCKQQGPPIHTPVIQQYNNSAHPLLLNQYFSNNFSLINFSQVSNGSMAISNPPYNIIVSNQTQNSHKINENAITKKTLLNQIQGNGPFQIVNWFKSLNQSERQQICIIWQEDPVRAILKMFLNYKQMGCKLFKLKRNDKEKEACQIELEYYHEHKFLQQKHTLLKLQQQQFESNYQCCAPSKEILQIDIDTVDELILYNNLSITLNLISDSILISLQKELLQDEEKLLNLFLKISLNKFLGSPYQINLDNINNQCNKQRIKTCNWFNPYTYFPISIWIIAYMEYNIWIRYYISQISKYFGESKQQQNLIIKNQPSEIQNMLISLVQKYGSSKEWRFDIIENVKEEFRNELKKVKQLKNKGEQKGKWSFIDNLKLQKIETFILLIMIQIMELNEDDSQIPNDDYIEMKYRYFKLSSEESSDNQLIERLVIFPIKDIYSYDYILDYFLLKVLYQEQQEEMRNQLVNESNLEESMHQSKSEKNNISGQNRSKHLSSNKKKRIKQRQKNHKENSKKQETSNNNDNSTIISGISQIQDINQKNNTHNEEDILYQFCDNISLLDNSEELFKNSSFSGTSMQNIYEILLQEKGPQKDLLLSSPKNVKQQYNEEIDKNQIQINQNLNQNLNEEFNQIMESAQKLSIVSNQQSSTQQQYQQLYNDYKYNNVDQNQININQQIASTSFQYFNQNNLKDKSYINLNEINELLSKVTKILKQNYDEGEQMKQNSEKKLQEFQTVKEIEPDTQSRSSQQQIIFPSSQNLELPFANEEKYEINSRNEKFNTDQLVLQRESIQNLKLYQFQKQNLPFSEEQLSQISYQLVQKKLQTELYEIVQNITIESNNMLPLRNILIKRMQFIVANIFLQQSVSLRLYGSCATGLALPESDIDLGLTGFENIPKGQIISILQMILELSECWKFVEQTTAILSANIPVLKIICNPLIPFSKAKPGLTLPFSIPNDANFLEQMELSQVIMSSLNIEDINDSKYKINLDITIENFNIAEQFFQYSSNLSTIPNIPLQNHPKNHLGILSTQLMNSWLQYYPILYGIAILIKKFLSIRELNIAYKGGLNSYSILIMIISFYKEFQNGFEQNLDIIFRQFLQFYGNTFDSSKKGIYFFQNNSQILVLLNYHQYRAFFDLTQTNDSNIQQSIEKNKIIIYDPVDNQHNITANSYQFAKIQSEFRNAISKIEYFQQQIKQILQYLNGSNPEFIEKQFSNFEHMQNLDFSISLTQLKNYIQNTNQKNVFQVNIGEQILNPFKK